VYFYQRIKEFFTNFFLNFNQRWYERFSVCLCGIPFPFLGLTLVQREITGLFYSALILFFPSSVLLMASANLIITDHHGALAKNQRYSSFRIMTFYTFRVTINCKSERHKTWHKLTEAGYSFWKSSNVAIGKISRKTCIPLQKMWKSRIVTVLFAPAACQDT